MSSIAHSPVTIQTASQSVPSTPCWFGEVTVIAHFLKHQGVLSAIEEQVRFARRRFGHYDTIDFVAVLLGYAISGERTLETFYERVQPFATTFMALFGRECLPHRSTLSRFLAALDQAPVEALRTTILQAHTHQWLGTFSGVSGAGNGDYRGELRQAVKAISAYVKAHAVQPRQAVARLDGQYGNGAIVADLAGLAYVMRGKDYDLLNLPQVQARLAQPPDQQT